MLEQQRFRVYNLLMITKTKLINKLLAKGEESKALTVASRLARLGEHRDDILRAKAAKLSPALYTQMGYNVSDVIDQGHRAVYRRFQGK